MSADTTSVRYLCPFCDYDAVSPDSVKSHVTESTSGKHKGKNGYTMSETIETVQDKSKLPMIQRIQEAAEQFDEPLSYDEAEQVYSVASDSDDSPLWLSKYAILRIWQDDSNFVKVRSDTSTSFDDLTEQQKEMVAVKECTEKSNGEIADVVGVIRSTVESILSDYRFVARKEFDRQEVRDYYAENFERTDDTSETEQVSVIDDKEVSDFIEALSDAGVDYEIEAVVNDDDFTAIEKLIEAGHSDIAEEHFYE